MSTATLSHPPPSMSAPPPTAKRIIQKRWVCDVCKTKWFLDFNEACAHEKVCGQSQPDVQDEVLIQEDETPKSLTQKEVIEIVDSTDSDVSPVKTEVRRSKRARRSSVNEPSNNAAKAKSDHKTEDKATPSFFKPKAKKSKAPSAKKDAAEATDKKNNNKEQATTISKRSKKDPKSDTPTAHLSQKEIAEHQAASFFAKRKQAQREERERQKKREEARRGHKKEGEELTGVVVIEKTRKEDDLEVKFPRFHVLGEEMDGVVSARGYGFLSYPHEKVDLMASTAPEPMSGLSFFGDDIMPNDHSPNIHHLFSSVFQPAKTKSPPTSKLWIDKHTPTQSTANEHSASKLSQFIEEWKIRRHKSTLRKKTRRRKSGYDSDDSFLDDEGGRTSLFVITGPTGSGKSRLVHATSSTLDCVVMEINSSEARGGTVLKKRVLESTLSHSSVALMKKREGGGSKSLVVGKREKEFFDEESSSEEEEESSSLTVILIDEVDLLFQDHGDTGFWQAISQLSQKAKSPIVLTATSMPPELLSGSFKFEHIELQRPSIEECCCKIEEVAKAEGMVVKNDAEGAKANSRLSLIAEYFQCDIRKILNEMQLFHASITYNPPGSTQEVTVFPRGWKARSMDGADKSGFEDDRPVILSIDPILIPRDRHTLITIEGKNFRGTEQATLFLGGVACRHFSVASDSKIIAVCPPLVIPNGVSKGLVYESLADYPIKCLSSKFVNVVVRTRCSNKLFLDSSSCPPPNRATWNLEYDAPIECSLLDQRLSKQEFLRKAKAQQKRSEKEADNGFMSSSDEEVEFEGDCRPQPSEKKVIIESSDEEEEKEEADHSGNSLKANVLDVDPQTLLNDALSELMNEQPNQKVAKTCCMNQSSSTKEMDTFAEEMGRMSNVAFLDDALVGLPLLSGAVEGLGSQSVEGIFTDSIPADPTIDKLSKETLQRPGFESLCLGSSSKDTYFYGDVDAYMVHPCTQRERFLLINSQLHSRGLGALDTAIETESSDKESPDSIDEELESPELKPLSLHTKSEDDMMLPPQPSSTHLLLNSLLGKHLSHEASITYRSNIEDRPWLKLRMQETQTKALETMSNLLAPENSYEPDWNRISFGIRNSDRFNGMAYKGQILTSTCLIDDTLALDYLPYLRTMASYENKMHLISKEVMHESDQSSRKSKRRKPSSSCREHYLLDKFCSKYGNFEDDLIKLGDSYLMKD